MAERYKEHQSETNEILDMIYGVESMDPYKKMAYKLLQKEVNASLEKEFRELEESMRKEREEGEHKESDEKVQEEQEEEHSIPNYGEMCLILIEKHYKEKHEREEEHRKIKERAHKNQEERESKEGEEDAHTQRDLREEHVGLKPSASKKTPVGHPKIRRSIGAHLIIDEFGLNEKYCALVVSDEHLEEFSRCYAEHWREVTAYLELRSIVFKDIDRKNVDEGEKRLTFFTEWKFLKSAGATYEKLVTAFLRIGDRDDAEALCTMLKISGPSISAAEEEEQSVYLDGVRHQLHLNHEDIIGKYESYVRSIITMLTEKKVEAEDLRLFLLILLSDHPSVAAKVEAAKTLQDILFALENYFSFWDYDIFQKIVVEFDLDSYNEKLQYAQHFESYVSNQNVSQFIAINPCLLQYDCSNPDDTKNSKKLTLKFDYDITKCRLADVRVLKDILATTLNMNPSALRLLDLQEGCIEITCLIPTQLADSTFMDNWKAVVEKSEKFQEMSLLSITCNCSTFVTKEEKLVPAEEKTKLTSTGSSKAEKSYKEARSEILKLIKDLTSPTDDRPTCNTSVLQQEIQAYLELMNSVTTDHSFGGVLASSTSFKTDVVNKLLSISYMVFGTSFKKDIEVECKTVCEESLKFLSFLEENKTADKEVAVRAHNLHICVTIYMEKIMDFISTDREAIGTFNIGDKLNEELASTAQTVEASILCVQEMLQRSSEHDSGVKLDVNKKVLTSCADLMTAVKGLLALCREILLKIVLEETGNASCANEFFKKQSRWSKGLLSLTQQMGKNATMLVDIVDRAVSSTTKYTEAGIASQNITATTAQLVAACGIRLRSQSDDLKRLKLLSTTVFKAKREVEKAAAFTFCEKEAIAEVDYSQMSFIKLSRHRMELETIVQKVEKQLREERGKLSLMKREGREMESKMKVRNLEEELITKKVLLNKIRSKIDQ